MCSKKKFPFFCVRSVILGKHSTARNPVSTREIELPHPPPFDLDRFAAGELTGDRKLEIQSHLDVCETCSEYIAGIEEDRAALLVRSPPTAFAYRVQSRIGEQRASWPRSRVALGMGFAAAAVSGIGLWILLSLPASGPETTRWMGGAAAVQVYLNRGGQTRTLDGLRPVAGDRLSYGVTLPSGKKAYAVLVAIEGDEVFPVLPSRVDADPLMIAGESLLPGSVEIEPGKRPTVLLLIVRERAFEVERIIGEIREASKGGTEEFNLIGLVHRLEIVPG
jgi:anti-sigma factor RsiW